MAEHLVGDDRAAFVWAVFAKQTPAGKLVTERMSRGLDPAVTDQLLVAIREEWEAAGRPIVEPHVHRDPVTFSDGTTIVGARFLVDDPYSSEGAPSFGLYLDERWAPPWPHENFDWPDFGVPEDLNALRLALMDLVDRARNGELVEIGCLGGHGRTGTALACIAILTGTPANDALEWVRTNYCHKAARAVANCRPVKAVTGFLEFLTDSEGAELWYSYLALAAVNVGWLWWAGAGAWSLLGLVWPLLIIGPYVFYILVFGVLGLPSMIWEAAEDWRYERRRQRDRVVTVEQTMHRDDVVQ